MANSIQERAEKVTASFRDSLDTEVRDKLSGSALDMLTQMISEAISEQQLETAGRIDALAKSLRAESGMHELGL